MSAADPSTSAPPRAPDVAVAAGVEAALADVERQLVRQAPALRLVRPATPVTLLAAPPPPPPAPAPPKARRSRRPAAPPARRRPVAPVGPVRPVDDDPFDDDLLVDDERADETAHDDDRYEGAPPAPARIARRPVRRRIDLDELSPQQRAALGRLQARKVGRVVRDVSPWSVFKFSVLFWVCAWLILTVAGVILWKVGEGAGVIANVEKFYAKAAGEETFELDGRGVFSAAAGIGITLTVALTGLSVLLAILFNLVSDLTGGIRLSVVELESTRRPIRASRRAGSSPRPGDRSARVAPDVDADLFDDDLTDLRDDGSIDDGDEPDDDSHDPSAAAPEVPSLLPDPLFDDDEPSGVRSAAR